MAANTLLQNDPLVASQAVKHYTNLIAYNGFTIEEIEDIRREVRIQQAASQSLTLPSSHVSVSSKTTSSSRISKRSKFDRKKMDYFLLGIGAWAKSLIMPPPGDLVIPETARL